MAFGQKVDGSLATEDVYVKRDVDNFIIFNRERNAHACIMSIVFIVLYPLGAISIHLPIEHIHFLKNTYLKKKVMAMHAPIQVLACVMMTGGLALGIRLACYLNYFDDPVESHVVIGLSVVLIILVFQPIMGLIQHRHFKKTAGGKSIFAYLHRWIGRSAVVLGMINSGLGFQLAQVSGFPVPTGAYITNYVFLGVLVAVWLSLVVRDNLRMHQKMSSTGKRENEVNDKKITSG